MNGIARRDASFRRDLFEETGRRRGLRSEIVEKDFWVCWTLKQLFSLPSLSGRLTFKGGTTLSKIHGIVRRFSEDIDLTLDRVLFGFADERDPNRQMDRKRRKGLIKQMVAACRGYIQSTLIEALRDQVSRVLDAEWELLVDPEAADGQALLFRYPTTVAYPDYIKPAVKMELGSRSDPWPTTSAEVSPYAAEEFASVFAEPRCEVVALHIDRTFWETATILHEEAHRPSSAAMPPRYSRHYYDLALLAKSPVARSAISRPDLLELVVWHKITFFTQSWSDFESAKPGTFRLMPPPGRLSALATDYRRMRPMFFEDPPPFADILATLQALENSLNENRAPAI